MDFEPAAAFAFEEMSQATFVATWAPPSPLVSLLPPAGWRSTQIIWQTQYQFRFWEEGNPVPDWEDQDVFTVTGPNIGAVQLASIVITKSKLGPSDPVVTEQYQSQVRWRWLWEPPADPMNWRFFHVRWRPEETLNELEGTITVTHGDMVEHWWQGEIPEDYDPEDPETWPGTPWSETPLPACPPPPDPGDFSTVTNQASTYIQWVWPHADLMGGTPYTGFELFAPGLIPGASDEAWFYQRPHSNGLIYGYTGGP